MHLAPVSILNLIWPHVKNESIHFVTIDGHSCGSHLVLLVKRLCMHFWENLYARKTHNCNLAAFLQRISL